MKISEVINVLKAEKAFKRTQCGRPITELASKIVDATLEDTKNYGSPAFSCKNCCIILSSLLVSEGCPLCGLKQKIKGE